MVSRAGLDGASRLLSHLGFRQCALGVHVYTWLPVSLSVCVGTGSSCIPPALPRPHAHLHTPQPQNEHIELHRKRHGRRMDHDEVK